MHDRENAGALEIVASRGDRIGEEPANVATVLAGEGRYPRRDEGVDIASLQQRRDGGALRRVFHARAGGQLDGDLFGPAGMLDSSPHPNHVGRLHAVVVLQDDARPHAGGELIFRQPDAPALEIGRRRDPVAAHIDRVVTECPRNECRHAHIRAVALGGLHREARQRQFADVEVHAAEGAEEDLLGRQVHEHGIDAVDLDRAVHQRTHAVVVADGDG